MGDLKEMNKVLKVVGLVVLALVVLVALVIVFVPIDGYTMLARIQAARERNKPLSPNYTATQYEFKSDGTVESWPASSLVDIKLNGSDQPIKVTVPASYTLSWTIDKSLLDGTYDCAVTGWDETGGPVSTPVTTASGEWKITGAAFTRDRVPAYGLTDIYSITCSNSGPDRVIEDDNVEVWFNEPTGQ